MPNGGSDCCGTCWFNEKNKGEPGYAHVHDRGEDRCEIRNLPITHALYCYCANHPHHNPGGMLAGPRKAQAESPDTEEIRLELIRLLEAIPEQPHPEYPSATQMDDEIIRQLGAWRERRDG